MSRSVLKYVVWFTGVIIVILTFSTCRYFFLPDIKILRNTNPTTTSFIRYRERQWKKSGNPRTVTLRWVPYGHISKNVTRTVVVSEDAKFWRHHGFDFAEMKNAAQTNLEEKRFKFGASTISQQLVKNLYLKPSKNVFRKIAEAILTWRLERTLSKQRIFEIYLNVIEWGEGIFGIGQAARHYFGTSPGALTREEAARLAVVLPSPLRYNPLSDGGYIERRVAVIMERAFPEMSVIPISGSGAESHTDTVAQKSTDSIAVPSDVEARKVTTGPVAEPMADTSGRFPAITKSLESDTIHPMQQPATVDTAAAR